MHNMICPHAQSAEIWRCDYIDSYRIMPDFNVGA